jgi:hypothetical protein
LRARDGAKAVTGEALSKEIEVHRHLGVFLEAGVRVVIDTTDRFGREGSLELFRETLNG